MGPGDRLKVLRAQRVSGSEVNVVFENGARKLRLSRWGLGWSISTPGIMDYRGKGTDNRGVAGVDVTCTDGE